MPSTFSPNKNYELQATGENNGTWGIKADADFSIIDLNFGGRFNVDVSGTGNFDVNATQAENVRHVLTGVLSGNRVYRLPNVGSFYIVTNNTTGAPSLAVANVGGGAGKVLARGATALYFTNPDTPGVDLVYGSSSADGTQYWGGTATGSGSAYLITVPEGVGPALVAGQVFNFLGGFINAGAASLNVNSLGSGVILRLNGSALTGGEISTNSPASVIFDGVRFRLLSQINQGGLLNVRYFTTPGTFTYTPTVGTNKVRVRVLGGGGGGGGVGAANSSQIGTGRAGGGGGYSEDFITSGFAGVTITVGAGGVGGATGNHSGANGGTSSFGSLLSATGGAAGTGAGSGAAPQLISGTQGGSGIGGSINAVGGQAPGYILSALTNQVSGIPGAPAGYGAAITGRISAGDGSDAGTYGTGGSGGFAQPATGPFAGGNGTQGFVIVEEYF